MALVNTTLAAACAATDSNITVTSATSIAAGVRIDYASNGVRTGRVNGKLLPAILAATGWTPKRLDAELERWRRGQVNAMRRGGSR